MFLAQGHVPTKQRWSFPVILFIEGVAPSPLPSLSLYEGWWVMEGAGLKESEGE